MMGCMMGNVVTIQETAPHMGVKEVMQDTLVLHPLHYYTLFSTFT